MLFVRRSVFVQFRFEGRAGSASFTEFSLLFFFLLRFNRFGTPQTQIQTKGAAMTKFRCYIYFKGFSALLRTMYLVLLGFIWLFIACVSKSKLPSFSDVSRVFEVQ